MPRQVSKSILTSVAALGGCVLTFGASVPASREALKSHGAEPPAGVTEDFFSGAGHYAIPVRYNPGITRFSEKRNYSALSLMLFLPDFSPAGEHPDEMKRPGWHDQMTLLFEHGPRVIDPDAQIAWMTSTPRGVHTPPEAGANGCDLYRTPFFDPGDVYVCPEDGTKLVLSCGRSTGAVIIPSPSCTVFENISPDLSVIYTYGVKYVADAVSIDRYVRVLIASFARPEAVPSK